jgi:hypothetical protein
MEKVEAYKLTKIIIYLSIPDIYNLIFIILNLITQMTTII